MDARVVDVAVELAIEVTAALGAGRPHLGVRVLADTFPANQWTEESTTELLYLLQEGQHDIDDNPDWPPWKALYDKRRLAPYGNDIRWHQLNDTAFAMVWAMASARGIYWGLTHEKEMPEAFAAAKTDFERTAAETIRHGIAVPAQFPWNSLEQLYETCEDMVRTFESVRPPLHEIPSALRAAPEVSRRLKP